MATEPAFENLDQHPKPQVMTQIRKNSAASTGEVERAYNICSAQQSARGVRVRDVIKFVMNFQEPTHRSHPISTGEVERAYNICSAQQSVRFPQDDLDHSVLEIVISQIILELGLSPEILT